MTTSAIILMIISMLLIWGGLFVASLHLQKNPDLTSEEIENYS